MANKFACALIACVGILGTVSVYAQNSLEGIWQSIDDKSGSPKAILEIKKDSKGLYNASIIEFTPRLGYSPKQICARCPAPYTNQPILGMKIVTKLRSLGKNQYGQGQVIDPLTGIVYRMEGKLSQNGNHFTIRGYTEKSNLARTQTWLRAE